MTSINQKIILLVEDERVTAMLEVKQLENEGYKILHVKTGEEAIELVCVRKELVHLILMDIDLGKGIDGTEAAEQILRSFDLPVLFLSSHTEKDIVEKTEKITNYGYVVKNSSFTVLDASIKMAFKLFDAQRSIQKQRMDIEAGYEEMQASNEELISVGNKLIESEYQYKSLFQNLNNSFSLYEVVFDENENPVDYKFLAVNPAYEKTVGINASELLGKTLLELFPRTEVIWIETIKRVVLTGTAEMIEHYAIEVDKYIEQLIYIPQKGQMAFIASDITARKKTELALQTSEQEYRSTVDSLLVGVVVHDSDTHILLSNSEASNILGLTAEQMLGKAVIDPVWRFIHTDLSSMKEEDFPVSKAIITKKMVKNYEFGIIRPDRDYITWVNVNAVPIFNVDNKLEKVVVNFVDITERKQVEQQAKNSQLLLKSSLDSPKDMVIMSIDKNYRYLYFNKGHEFAMKYGYDIDVKIGMNVLECITSEEDREKAKYNYDKAMSGEPYHTIEEYGVDDIVTYESFFNPIFDDTNKVIGIVAFARNITDRKLAEKELLNEQQFSDTIINTIVDTIFVFNPITGKPLKWNQAFVKTSGYTSKEIALRKAPDEWYNQQDLDKACREMDELAKGAMGMGTIEMSLISKDGRLIPTEYTSSVICDSEGVPKMVIAVGRDVTERKKSEDKIKHLLHEKELVLKEVHHRIKNNMTTIGALLQLQANTQVTLETKEVLQDAAGRLNSMRVLYDKLYHSENFGTLSLKEYIPPLIKEIVNIFPQPVKVESQIEDIQVDVKLLSSIGIILNEMITNSMKYAFTTTDSSLIAVSASKNSDLVTIVYEDNGVSLPEEITFENSTGFGMQLITMLVDQILGAIRIERDNGTRFIIEFKI